MGDVRFLAPYRRVQKARDPSQEIRLLSDEEIIAALTAAAAQGDRYVSNILTTEAQNRVIQYAAIVSTMPEGVFAVGPLGLLASLNAAAERILGWTSAEVAGMEMDELLSATVQGPDGRWRASAVCAETLRSREARHEEEVLFTRRDGSRFAAEYTAAPIVREGETRGAVVVFRDITERRRTEADVRRLAAIVQASDDSILSLALDGTILTWNPRAEEIYGYPAEHAIGKHATLVVPEELLPTYHRILERVGAGETVRHHETQRIRRGGRVLDISLTASPIRNALGEVVAISWIGHDITEAKRHEEALRTSERRYRLLLDSVTHHAIFTLDARGHVTSWNPAAERIKGWKEDEILGWHYSVLFPPEEVAAGDPWKELEEARQKGRYDGEERRMRKDGRLFDASVTLSAMHDEAGEVVGFVKVTRDVTERKEWERRLETGEARNDHLFQMHPDALAWHDGKGGFAAVNKAFAHMLGFERHALEGRDLSSIAVADDHEKAESAVRAVLDGKETSEQFRAMRGDGRIMAVSCHLTPILVDGIVTGFFSRLLTTPR